MKRKGIGSHQRPNQGEYQVWLTPKEIIVALGEFDIDPCAAPEPRPWPTAREHITLPADGLSVEWEGRVWMNPPYDEVDKWMEKMSEHPGIALLFARTEIGTWQRWVWPYAYGILFVAGRISFCFPDGTKAYGNSGGPSALIAYSQSDAEILYHSGIAGAFVEVCRYMCGERIREIAPKAPPFSQAAMQWKHPDHEQTDGGKGPVQDSLR